MTGRMVLPKEESCAIKYPREVLLACSRAALWLGLRRGEKGSTRMELDELEVEAAALEEEDVFSEAALAPSLLLEEPWVINARF